ncbi:MAG: 4'-phosphopantetheinyl transferase superfamily protein [Terrimonas sp.]|nr:4'-phosphopantetheinyl transferase superfamily protein [Terrimonas sp.]
MPIFFQQQINDNTRLGIWKIEESEAFFKHTVPQHRAVTHPHKRLQHLAGRFLLQFLYPGFPFELIAIADTRKPYLPGEEYHFSISHCGDYAAAIVSRTHRVGIDIELPVEKVQKLQQKFLSPEEFAAFDLGLPTHQHPDLGLLTRLWSAKESVFKWYGNGSVDFREHIQLKSPDDAGDTIDCQFTKTGEALSIHYRHFHPLVLCWVLD